MDQRKTAILFVVSAPSGAGKTTVLTEALAQFPDIRLSVSCTTREPRVGEKDGRDYFFISSEEFTDMVQKDLFIEWAQVHGAYYGTPRSNLQYLDEGFDVILEIDTQGAQAIKGERPDAVSIFIVPPSLAVLEQRLRARGENRDDVLSTRLLNARKELAEMEWYDYSVVNDELTDAVRDVRSIIIAERCRTARVKKDVRRRLWPESRSKIV
jgi:guanylate kinase